MIAAQITMRRSHVQLLGRPCLCSKPQLVILASSAVALPTVGGILILLAAGFGALTWKGRQRRREQSRAASIKSIRPFVMLDVQSAQASASGEATPPSTDTAHLHPVGLELDAHAQPIVLGRGSCGKVSRHLEILTSGMHSSETFARRVHRSSGDAVQLHPVIVKLDAIGQPNVLGRGSCRKVFCHVPDSHHSQGWYTQAPV